MIAFGPVPSRRLGRSLGINNIPPKACTYSCVYCQVGRTADKCTGRCSFYEPRQILEAVRERLQEVRAAGEAVDYLTFVPDGEPTLDGHLGRAIKLLRPLGLPIAVISNASLVWRADVRAALMEADWVSLKLDSVREETWRRIDRPHGKLKLPIILDGALAFAGSFKGTLVTETMLVEGLNDDAAGVEEVAGFLSRLRPATAYLSIPTRPPAEDWVRPPGEEVVNRAYQIFSAQQVGRVEYLIGYEGNAFASTGSVVEDLLGITAVHPMREDALRAFLARAGADEAVVRRLVADGELAEITYREHKFYLRRWR